MNKILLPSEKELEEFLRESNAIESVYTNEAKIDAWDAWKFLFQFDELTLSRILECHRLLMKNLNNRIAGKIRNVDVYVGGMVKLNPLKIIEELNDLTLIYPMTEEQIKQWHVNFEDIHPFEDGNGRTGRLLLNWQRVKNGLPILIIHEGHEQYEYYRWFRE